MLRKMQAGLPEEPAAPVAEPSRVINLMDALKRSVAAERSTPARADPERHRAAKQPAARTVKKRLRRAG